MPSAGAFGRNLTLRIASAAVLVPVALAFAYVGGWLFLILCALGAGGILWEWTRLVTARSDPRILAPGWAALLAALAFTASEQARRSPSAMRWRSGAVLAGMAEATPKRRARPGVGGRRRDLCRRRFSRSRAVAPRRRIRLSGFPISGRDRVDDGHLRLLGGPQRRRSVAVAAGKPEKDVVGGAGGLGRGGCGWHSGRLCERGRRSRERRSWRWGFRPCHRPETYSNPRSSGALAQRIQAGSFPDMVD